jgi:hypothetical protein
MCSNVKFSVLWSWHAKAPQSADSMYLNADTPLIKERGYSEDQLLGFFKSLRSSTLVLDRFQIAKFMNQAVDEVRRAVSTRLRARSKVEGKQLKNMHWPLLRRGSRVRGRSRKKLNTLLASKLDTARA